MTRRLAPVTIALALLAAVAADSAQAAKRFTIRGAGYGHGVGFSQYGAFGYAEHGWDYRRILAHYYSGTSIGVLKDPRVVRVLLQAGVGSARFKGASRAGGRSLSPSKTYYARSAGGGSIRLLGARGRALATVAAPLRATGPGPLRLYGAAGNGRSDGAYRGALEFRPGSSGGVNAINAVDVDDYTQGVVPLEVPASWPAEALKAQAVAARTYAVTTGQRGAGFELYANTRSQVYGGADAEHPATNSAVAATAGQLVTYDGTPVVTYYFSTSGGRTESVENSALGTEPRPWLRSVVDKYDNVSPKHRWGPIRMSYGSAGAKLAGLVKGRFRGIKVTHRGDSPRIVRAKVVGTGGKTPVDGATLRARLGLYDSWAFFTSIKTRVAPPPDSGDGAGGTSPVMSRVRVVAALAGHVLPARRGARIRVQRRGGGRWADVTETRAGRGGRYVAAVTATGRYRVRFHGDAGPAVRVR
jgi:SpoIID/LytB domain protein